MKIFKTAVILAGGKSSRMGFDKQFLEINESRLMENLVCELKKEFEDIIIVTNKPGEYKESSCRIVGDEIKEMGPLSGIHIGLKESKSKYVYFIACDMPNINLDYISLMKREVVNANANACVTKKDGKIEPFNSFYSIDILQKIEKLILKNRRSMLALIDSIETIFIEDSVMKKYNCSFDMFVNLNTKEDLQMFKKKNIVEEKNV